jgi:hypothetical protein
MTSRSIGLLNGMLKAGAAALLYSGVAVNPLALRQLISLTRPGLEVEPMWWDRLRASTIVAPGAATVELGLQVARAVVS